MTMTSAQTGLPGAARRRMAMAFPGPAPLAWALGVTGGFAALVLGLSATYGLPLTPPTERVSLATGLHSGIPLAVGAGAYLIARLLHRLLGRSRADEGPIGRIVALDLSLIGLFVIACYLHFNLKMWVPLINPASFDDFYMRTDVGARGAIDAVVWLREAIAPAIPGVDRWYQGAFAASFVLSFVYFAVLDRRYYYRYIVATITMLCLGAASYLVAPAVGPFIYETGTNAVASHSQAGMWAAYQALREGGVPWLERYGSAYFTGALAAMPSLHVGHAFIAMTCMLQARSPLWPLFVLVFGWTVIESVASRWHYLIDAPVGLLLAILVLWLTARIVPVGGSGCR